MMTTVTFGNLTKADGSALVDHDDTVVQASVFGPVDVSQTKINYEEAIVEVLFKPKVSIPSSSPLFENIREIENLLKNTFKEVILTRLHPRTSISILVQEIHNGGSLHSAAINAVCCALLDAGLPLKCPVVGISVRLGQVPSDYCNFDLVFDSKLNILTIMTHGCFEDDVLREAIESGREEARKNFDTIRAKIRERFA